MPTATANGMQLYYEEVGDPAAPPVLLIMGLGTQMIAWPEAFVHGLAAAGYRVILYDNRDIGLSTRLDGAAAVHPLWAMVASRLRLPFPLAYTLTDMARDAVGLLDALGIDRAHLVGASMGGMIAQLVGAGWPDRVASLTLVMTSSGAPGLPGPTPALRRQLMRRRPANPSRDEAIEAGVAALSLVSFPDPTRDPGAFRAMAAGAFDRGYNPLGARRHLDAIIADGSRVDRLRTITAPTLVIHGEDDQLVPIVNGRDVARHVRGAEFVAVPGMAHDLPPSRVDRITALIAGHLARA